MASQEAHDWWADVQDEREALGAGRRRRAVAVWAEVDDFDLVPEHVMARRPVSDELAPRRAARRAQALQEDVEPEAPAAPYGDPADELPQTPIRGHRFVRAQQPQAREARPASDSAARRIVLEQAGEIDHVMPPRGEEVLKIKGRPEERRAPLPARYERRPSRSAREIVEHNPDRIMLWVTVLGCLLILLAFSTG